jgi:hypothetical protein
MKITVGKLATATAAGFLVPALALAQFGEINSFFNDISSFINSVLIPLVFAIALLVFLWGMFKFFILGGHEEESRAEGRSLMMYAVVGFVLMVSIFGIVNLIANGLGFSKDQNINNIPNAPTTNN